MKNNVFMKSYGNVNICSTKTSLMISSSRGVLKSYIATDYDFIEDEICEFLEHENATLDEEKDTAIEAVG